MTSRENISKTHTLFPPCLLKDKPIILHFKYSKSLDKIKSFDNIEEAHSYLINRYNKYNKERFIVRGYYIGEIEQKYDNGCYGILNGDYSGFDWTLLDFPISFDA